mmetsp:Transcript_14708/g.20528  ORF Transcript_14708/g.20528 Transcript_14708/m.20528 type:complete len:451 (+) Transcript_14708:29-1381(+)
MDSKEEGTGLLKYLYLFDSDLDVKEGQEHEKLLYYWPAETDLQIQTKLIGFSEALVNFTKQFSPDRPCETVRFQKQKCAYYHPEEGIWMVVAVHNLAKENEVPDAVLHNLLRRCYQQFVLFHGKMRRRLADLGRPRLIRSFSVFLPQFLASFTFNRTPFFDAMDGLQFFPVDRNIYLQIQCFVNLIESTFPDIRETVVLYDSYLVWSGLDQRDIRPLYQYVSLASQDKSLSKEPPFPPSLSPSGDELVYMKILRAIKDQTGLVTFNESKDEDCIASACQMYTSENVENSVAVYSKKKILCMFFMAPFAEIEFHSFEAFVSSRFDHLSQILSHRIAQPKDPLDGRLDYHCLYYNHMNQAMKSMSASPSNPLFPPETSHIVMQIHDDFEKNPEEIREVMMKMKDGRWMVGRKSEQREFYSLFNPKEDISNIIDIQDFVQKLNLGYFGNIFLH